MPPPPGYQAEDPIVVNNPDDDSFGSPRTTFLADGGFVVLWTEYDGLSPQSRNVRAQVFDVSSARVGDNFLIHEAIAGDQRGGRVAPLSSGGFVVTWVEGGVESEVRARFYDEAGQPVGASFLVSVPGNASGPPDIATLMSGNVVIVWEQFEGADGGWAGSGIHWSEFEPSGARVAGGTNTRVYAEIPQVAALDSGGFAISYTNEDGRFNLYPDGMLWQVYGPNAGPEVRTQQRYEMPGQEHAIANLETGGFVMVWAANTSGSGNMGTNVILAQICAADGTRLGGAFQVNMASGGQMVSPAIVSVPGVGFAVAWRHVTAPDYPIRVQFFSNEGVRIGDEFLVEEAGHEEGRPYLAADGLGSVLIGWIDAYQESGGSYVVNLVARLFALPNADATRGDDMLAGTAAADTMRGGTGHDSYLVNHVDDRPIEQPGEGIDTVFTSISYTLATATNIEGLETADAAGTDPLHLTGNLVYNRIVGNAGDNRIDGGLGKDEMVGLGGHDTYVVDNQGDTVTEAAGGGTDIIYTGVSYSLGDSSEVESLATLVWEATTALELTGNALANTLIGNAGANRLDGAGGADIMFGREGHDTYVVDNAGDQAIEYGGQGADIIYSSVSYSLNDAYEVESLVTRIWEATDAIDLTGNSLNNALVGNAGNNRLDGAAGSDIMIGREGNDTYVFDNAGDQAIEQAGQGSDIIYATISYSLNDGSEVEALAPLSFEGTASLNFTGNALVNTLIGNDGDNQLDGRGGADVMVGRAGGDIYLVDHATDAAFESVGGGYDVIYTNVSFALTNDQEIEGLSTITWELTTAIDLTGNAADNYLIGNAGSNVLDGKGGNDVLQGREGADTFAFTTVPGAGNADLILGFVAADDTIRLEGAAFGGLPAGPLDADAFVTGTAAQDGEDRIVYNQATGQLFFDADGSGSGAAILFATLQGAPVITAGDFAVI